MKKAWLVKISVLICFCLPAISVVFAQANKKIQEIPVLIKHLPDWENIQASAVYISNPDELRKALGERAIFDLINPGNGIEAVTATYPQGKLLIVEYPTPQASIDVDLQIKLRLTEIGQDPPIYYRRIGNYNAFVFDPTDEASANALLDQVKYEKTVQWLGENPMPAIRAEREFAIMTGDIFLSTMIVVVVGFGSTILAGIIVGLLFFYIREQKRATTHIFTDAGGMTRLNLDGLTPDVAPERLLKD